MPLLVALLVVAGLALGALPSTGSGRAPAADLDRKVEEARGLIDEWGGDSRKLIQAGALLNEAGRGNPNHAAAHAQAARVVYRLGYQSGDRYHPFSLARARTLAERAIALDPRLPDAYVVAGYVALFDGRVDEVERLADKAEALDPASDDVLILLARRDRMQRRYDAAVERLGVVLARVERPATRRQALSDMAFARCDKVEDDACEAAHRALVEFDPRSAWARGNFASVLVGRKKYDEAIEMAESALELMNYGVGRTALAQAHFGKGWALFERGDVAGAQRHFEAALEAHPVHADAHYGMGAVHLKRLDAAGTPDERASAAQQAEKAFRRALMSDPANASYRKAFAAAKARREALGVAEAPAFEDDEDQAFEEDEAFENDEAEEEA
jgi:tetratricopeptide (TPR) repeat protein